MAKILTDTITIKLSKLVRTATPGQTIVDGDFRVGLEAVVTEMLGDESVIVEIEDLGPDLDND